MTGPGLVNSFLRDPSTPARTDQVSSGRCRFGERPMIELKYGYTDLVNLCQRKLSQIELEPVGN